MKKISISFTKEELKLLLKGIRDLNNRWNTKELADLDKKLVSKLMSK